MKNNKTKSKFKWAFQIIMAAIGLVGAVYSYIRMDNAHESSDVIFSIIFMIFFAIIFIVFAFKALFNSPKVTAGGERSACCNFYYECLKYNIKSPKEFDSQIASKRAETIIENWGMRDYIIELGFQNAFIEGEKEAKVRKEKAQIAGQKKEEKEAVEKLQKQMKRVNWSDKYIHFHGKDKTRNMLSDMVLIEKGSTYHAYEFNQGVKGLKKQVEEPEVAWGWIGGIADGIAGGAAGLVAASETEARNAEARAHNAKVEQEILSGTRDGYWEAVKKDNQHRKNAEKYEGYINKLPQAIILNEDSKSIFNDIDMSVSKITRHRYGNFVSLSVNVTGKKYIEKGVRFVTDGTIKAQLVQNEKVIGNAYFVLPWNGLDFKQISMTKMIICSEAAKKDLEVKFIPHDLWVIESLESMK